jgi:16S rRNA (guanine(527)-N(7))-methyltransferase RsmG
MIPARIAALLHPFLAAPIPNGHPAVLSQTQFDSISTYIDILLRWNARVNLTAIRDPEEIVTRHFGESLFAARVLFPVTAHVGTDAFVRPAERRSAVPALEAPHDAKRGRAALECRQNAPEETGARAPGATVQRSNIDEIIAVADVGSGAGFPGIPLKLWHPAIHLTLIESNQKKSTFLKELVRALTLTDIDIQNARAEALPHRSFDVVTLRAVERFDTILPLAATVVKPGGRLALLVGKGQLETAHSLLPHLAWFAALPIPLSQSRILLIGQQ